VTLVAERPEAATPRPWRFPAFERRELAGGRLIACHLPGRPLAIVSLLVDAGAVHEPVSRAGVGELLVNALSEGTRRRDAHEFAVAGERLGASWRAAAGWDSTRCGFEVPAGSLAAATELLAEAVREPGLDDVTLDRVRDERLDEIRIERSQPGSRAAQAFAGALWEPDSRYAILDGGDTATVAATTNDDIRDCYARRFGPGVATLVVAGDLGGVDVDALARTVFDGWPATAAVADEPALTPRLLGRRVLVVDRPGAVQSMLYVGHDGPARSVPDYVPLTTMSLVLGGMFSSRLNLKLREEKGYAYGAFGVFDTRKHAGTFVARAAVKTDVTVPALADLVGEIERMQADGVAQSELEQARSYRAGVFPISFAGSQAVAAGLGDLVTHGLADDHYDRLRASVLSVTKDELDRAAASRLRPNELVTVVVGDAASFADQLTDSGLGPVEVVPDEA
jgi:predicted Zn-dependent peptidase